MTYLEKRRIEDEWKEKQEGCGASDISGPDLSGLSNNPCKNL